jgi:formate C-acetyltransferase
LGGVRPEDGGDAVNELSFMILEACKRVGKPGGNCTARIGGATPPAFVMKCAEVIQTGIGYPAVFNDDLEVESLLAMGYPAEHARDYCFVGCIEVQIQGRHAPWADDRVNPLHAVNLALFNGVDSLTGQVCDVPFPDDPGDFEAFDRADSLQRPYDANPKEYTAPLLSAFTADCIVRGRDVNDGGAVYPGDYGFGCMGIASVADSLMAVKHAVYDPAFLTLDGLRDLCRRNFEGRGNERQRLLRGIAKFGNDATEVDAIAARVVEDLASEFGSRRTPAGGHYLMLMAANTGNVWAGAQVGATPDGRRAGTPVSDASSPSFGRDLNGPTAVIRSVGKLPYRFCPAGNVVNLKLSAPGQSDQNWRQALAALIAGAMRVGVSELQFNTTGAEALRDAMEHPETHGGLVVRVSGFSATFVTQPRGVQEDILARTEHDLARSRVGQQVE